MDLPGPVVSAEWLAENLDAVRVVDARWSMDGGPKHDDYLAAHVPTAVFADLDVDLSDPPGERGRHPLLSAEAFAESRSRLGLGSKPVVAYDDQSGAVAARLWWMLDSVNHPVAVLDGGIQAWVGELESGPARPDAEEVPVVPWPTDRFVVADDILQSISDGAVVVDARSAERFAGNKNPIDSRPGHIPGSVSRPWTDNVGADGRFLDPQVLVEQLGGLGVRDGVDVIASCGSGVTGCHDLLAARLAGVEGGRLYAGSWSEWSQGDARPVDTDL